MMIQEQQPATTLVGKTFELPYLQILAKSWSKNTYDDLFDYRQGQTLGLSCQTFLINYNCKIYRHAASYQTVIVKDQENIDLPIQYIYIASICINPISKKFKLQSADITKIKPHPYIRQEKPNLFRNSLLVVRDFQQKPGIEGYYLKAGSFVRFGRIQFLVTETMTSLQLSLINQLSSFQLNKNVYEIPRTFFKGFCRVCLSDQYSFDNPLIMPCCCKGSKQLIHLLCLKDQISAKIKKEVNQVAICYTLTKFCCQLCKTLYPKVAQYFNGKRIELILEKKLKVPYIVIQNITEKYSAKEETAMRQLYVIYTEQKVPVRLGRGNQCQVKIPDHTISRVHAEIRFDDGNFILKDLASKFGTFIKFREGIKVEKQVKIQHGCTCYTFHAQKGQEVEQMRDDSEEQSASLPSIGSDFSNEQQK